MRSGWPHTQDDHGRLADQRQVPFGPDISWPTGYSSLEYRDGDYRYPAQQASHGEHPYAAFTGDGYGDGAGRYGHPSAADFGYGDPGYSDPGYDGPASQDAGIAGTRTVRGIVEPSQPHPGYPLPGAGQPGYPRSGYQYPPPGHGGIELAYPLPQGEQDRYAGTYHSGPYQQPWDYDQPLRYEDDPDARSPLRYEDDPDARSPLRYEDDPDARSPFHGRGVDGGSSPLGQTGQPADGYRPPAYGSGGYNGSDLSRPGIDGPGYDLSGIIGTGDFAAVGYDEPSYDRLSYDDPRYDGGYGDRRYDDTPRYGDRRYDEPAADTGRGTGFGARSDETRYDMPRFDETRLDRLWLADEDVQQDEPVGYGDDGFGTASPLRSGYPDPGTDGGTGFAGQRRARRPRDRRLDETLLDLRADDLRMDQTRFDVPAYDETRVDNMRALRSDLGRSATGLLAPPEHQPVNWPDETSLDEFTGLDVGDGFAQELPAAFVRPAERREDTDDDTATRRAIGRRRGRSRDKRQWMALGAIAVVAAGAIGGVLMKYVFSGPSGPAHTVVAPDHAGPFTRMPNLEKQMKVGALRNEVIKTSAGQAHGVVSAVYQQGSTAPGGNAQIFMFVGGELSSAAPATSIANFTQAYPGAKVVPAGVMGGEAACASETTAGGESVAMCVWFDNDSFGELVSPTMTTAKLASTLDSVRPSLELYAK